MSLDTLEKISLTLDLSLDYLFWENDAPGKTPESDSRNRFKLQEAFCSCCTCS